jgi:hypothetical protein
LGANSGKVECRSYSYKYFHLKDPPENKAVPRRLKAGRPQHLDEMRGPMEFGAITSASLYFFKDARTEEMLHTTDRLAEFCKETVKTIIFMPRRLESSPLSCLQNVTGSQHSSI